MTDPERVAAIAAGLTKASKRALVRIGLGWTEEGGSGPARKDAYSLWWGRDGKYKLVEQPTAFGFARASCSWKYRLTPLGTAVRAHLTRNTEDAR